MSGRLGLRKKKKGRGKTGENHDSGIDGIWLLDMSLERF